MPCYDSRGDANTREGRDELLRSFTHNSPLAEMLCTMCKAYLAATTAELPSSVVEWWCEHQKRDLAKAKAEQARKRREDVAAAARAKLSPTERKALGID